MPDSPPAVSSPRNGSVTASNACVLIIDDKPVNAALLERMLYSIGIVDVHTVIDPRQAVARCLELDADLVLLDLHMPGLDGHAVLGQLRAALSADDFLPVLVITADTTVTARDRALEAGAKDFLTKPLDYTEVVLRVRNLLETRSLHTSLRCQNAVLRDELEVHADQERRSAATQQARSDRIDAALAPGALQMVFQPIVDLQTGVVLGAEALARFGCEPRRPPNVWFDEASVAGRGAELELAAVAAALAGLDGLPDKLFLSINLSPSTAMLPELPGLLAPFELGRIVLELTEHARVDDYPRLRAALEPLRASGMRIAVDDTGTGYAGLSHLLELRPEIIKLDLALTRGIDADPARRALALALVSFGAEIGSVLIAEGVETAGELETLRRLGIGLGQGYHLGRPAVPPLGFST